MPNQRAYKASFFENKMYHIYNRTNNKELLFRSGTNYLFFLRQYKKFMTPFVDSFSYNLLPNHFHFLVGVKSEHEIKTHLQQLPNTALTATESKYLAFEKSLDELITAQWHRLFTSYAKAYNKWNDRTGNLFNRSFHRKEVENGGYFTQSIAYIHLNAQRHKIYKDFKEHRWSSSHSFLSEKPTLLQRDEVLDWFGGRQAFIEFHEVMKKLHEE